MTLEEFITTLKPMVRYNKIYKLHMMGNTILTNQEMDHMLKLLLGDEYANLNGTQREKIRERVFNELRGELQPISLDKETTYDEMMDNIRKDYPKEMAEVDEIRYCMYDTNARLYKKILEIIKR